MLDHPRGSGKTFEMAMMGHIALKCLGQRLLIYITDRTDLNAQLYEEVSSFLCKSGHDCETVISCGSAKEFQAKIHEMEENENACAVLAVTLQSFPHVEVGLSAELRNRTVVLCDEVHRSHADKSLSEELNTVLGGKVKLLMYTGTASDRCLCLFGDRKPRDGFEVCTPFHSVSEAKVAETGMVFELCRFQRKFVRPQVDMTKVDAAASEKNLSSSLVHLLHKLGGRTSSAVLSKAQVFLKEFEAIRASTTSFRPQLMVVCENRQAVYEYATAFKAAAAGLHTYGAFSGYLTHEGVQVTEAQYNRLLEDVLGMNSHQKADILVVCDRFETGYDNSAVSIIGIDKKMSSPEKIVQVYSRANRRRGGKRYPLVIDMQNSSKDVEEALYAFSVPRECLAKSGDVAALSTALRDVLAPVLDSTKAQVQEFLDAMEPECRKGLGAKLVPYLRCRAVKPTSMGFAERATFLPYSKARQVWDLLRERHSSDVAEVRPIAKSIVDGNAPLRRFSMLCLGAGAPPRFCRTFNPDQAVTPEPKRESCQPADSCEKEDFASFLPV